MLLFLGLEQGGLFFNERRRLGQLAGTGRLAKRGFPSQTKLRVEAALGEVLEPAGHRPAFADDEVVVHQHQRLRRHGGDSPLGAVWLHRRGVKCIDKRKHLRAAHLHVEAAAVFLGTQRDGFSRWPIGTVVGAHADDDLAHLVLLHRHRFAEHAWVPLAAHEENRVAEGLGLEPADAHAAEQPVVGVEFVELGQAARSLAVSLAGHDEPMQALEPPAVFHEVAGEPVEQFGVAWLLAQFAEVTRCIDQAAAEVVQPKAVDEHTARERMRPVGQALGQGQPSPGRGSPAIVLGDRVFIQRHHAQVGRFHGGLGLAVVAPEKKVRDRHFARLLGQRPDERLLRLGGADVGSLFGHGVE